MPSGADKVPTDSIALLSDSYCQAFQTVDALFHKLICAAFQTKAAQVEKPQTFSMMLWTYIQEFPTVV